MLAPLSSQICFLDFEQRLTKKVRSFHTVWNVCPILTLLLYGILEVFTNNVIEPVVLGGSTGMSPLAVIIAAAEAIGDSTVISWLSGYNASHERV